MASAEPDTPAAFDAAQMLGYLAEVDELLVKAGTTHELHLYVAGGAVIATKTDSRLTGDIDVISEGMTPQLRAAVKEVSQRHRGLRPDWLNDGAKLKRVNVALEPERIFTGRRLIVDSAGDRYVLAMKLVSHRQVDEADGVACRSQKRNRWSCERAGARRHWVTASGVCQAACVRQRSRAFASVHVRSRALGIVVVATAPKREGAAHMTDLADTSPYSCARPAASVPTPAASVHRVELGALGLLNQPASRSCVCAVDALRCGSLTSPQDRSNSMRRLVRLAV